ncbi:hypothetical protein WN48_06544 [Eufriesea mexicana]|uniref:Uncharacterized protein n=1 Tax=Eufriesea mexicana TaxID=516756 RepID=A0A310SLZ7_9HYME|nr:hypothetical protein WN48_06544 [Eufriesea mexicana]
MQVGASRLHRYSRYSRGSRRRESFNGKKRWKEVVRHSDTSSLGVDDPVFDYGGDALYVQCR